MIPSAFGLALLFLPAQALPREPVVPLGVRGRHVTINRRPTFLVGQMSFYATDGRSLDQIAGIIEVVAEPYGMNLWV